MKIEWILCPFCGSKTRLKIRNEYTTRTCPAQRQKKKIRRKADTFSRAYEAAALQNQGRRFFALILNQRRPNTV